MKILSLFDGIACGYEALLRAGITVDKYYASEIDKYAIQIAMKNHPDIIQIGDVCRVNGADYKGIDLLIGGSPCQGFSVAGKQLAFEDPRSKLFFEYVRILKEAQPKYFLLENVKMKKERVDIISGYLGVQPIEINSALVSAQSRKRLYRTNIPGVTQPNNRGHILKDILEDEVDEKYYLSEEQIEKIKYLKGPKVIKREKDGFEYHYREGGIPYPDIIERPSRTVLTSEGHISRTSHIIQVGYLGKNGTAQRVYSSEGKSVTLKGLAGGLGGKTGLYEDKMRVRKLTPIECERLQTLGTTKHRYEILFDFDDYEWFIEQTKNYASVVEKCHKSQSAVGNVEKGDGKDAVLSAEKSLNTNSPQTNKLVQENVLTSGGGEEQVKLFLDEQSMYVSDAEKNLKHTHLSNEENFVLGNADIDMLFERIVHLGNEGLLEKEGIYITQKSGIIQLKASGREIMQLVKGAEKDLTTLKRHFTSIILDHSNIENLEQKLATLFYYVLTVIVGCIQGITQTSNSLEINIETGYTAGVSDTQRYKMLGNGWTCDVVAHIFRFIP